MGKTVDSIAFGILTFFLNLMVFMKTGKSVLLCTALSMMAGVCVYSLSSEVLKRLPRFSVHKSAIRAEKQVKALIYADTAKAHQTVFELLARRYPVKDQDFQSGRLLFMHAESERCALCVLQKLRVSPDDIVGAWRSFGKMQRLASIVIAIPGKSEADVIAAAVKLSEPNAVVLTRTQLKTLFKKYAVREAPEADAHHSHPFQALRAFLTRKRAVRYLFYGLVLTAFYIVSGIVMYLISGAALLFLSFVSFRKRPEPEKLI